jgi:hypothetical protein
MKKGDVNFIVDFGAFLGFLALVSTGFMMYFVLPPKSGKNMVWGLTRHDWGDIHFWVSVVFFFLITIHTILHWKWITNMVKTRILDKMGTTGKIMLVLFILLLLFMTLAPLFSPVVGT